MTPHKCPRFGHIKETCDGQCGEYEQCIQEYLNVKTKRVTDELELLA